MASRGSAKMDKTRPSKPSSSPSSCAKAGKGDAINAETAPIAACSASFLFESLPALDARAAAGIKAVLFSPPPDECSCHKRAT